MALIENRVICMWNISWAVLGGSHWYDRVLGFFFQCFVLLNWKVVFLMRPIGKSSCSVSHSSEKYICIKSCECKCENSLKKSNNTEPSLFKTLFINLVKCSYYLTLSMQFILIIRKWTVSPGVYICDLLHFFFLWFFVLFMSLIKREMRMYLFVLPLETKALHIFSEFGKDTENVWKRIQTLT